MALTYKTDVITLNAANTDFTILTASASSTLVKNISWIHDDHNTNIILSITKSGGSKIPIGEYAATANTSTKIWTDVLPLEANDVLHLQSDHISGSDVGYCVISYVEDTASVAGQSIAVHTDVSISGITDGQVLEWNNSTTQFEPATASGGPTDTDGLSEGSSNLYFTDARVAANSAVVANTAKIATVADDTSPQLGENLDVLAREINTSTTDGNITLAPNGTGVLEVKGDTNSAAIVLNCENNSHGVTIQAPPHSAGATYTLTLPTSDGSNGQYMTTDGSGNLAFETFVLPDLAVGTDNIQDDAVTNDHILDDTVGPDELANTAVTPGSYTNTNITVDAQGRITSASTGSGGSITAVTGTAPIVSSGGNAPAISITAATPSAAGSMSAQDKTNLNGLISKYANNELITGPNTLMEGSSTTNDKIADVLGAAVASRDNANAKKMLGFHTGSGVYVLRGMVDAVDPINGASAGSPLWLGASGVFDSAPPDTTDHYSRIVGYFLGTGAGSEVLCYFDPSRDWVQID